MIEKIIKFSVKNRNIVLGLTGLVCLLGIDRARHLSIDALPDVTNIQVSVVTKAPGLSPGEVEQFITYPIELALNGMPNVDFIRSISRTGVSSVTVVFKDSVDIYFARQLVNERLRQAEDDIPEGYGRPELSPIATGLGDIYELLLMSSQHTPEQLRTYLDWELGPQLKSVPGVIDINVFGGELKQYQVVIQPSKLAAHQLSLSELLEKLRSANLNVGGGYIQKGPEQWVIRGEGQFTDLDDLRNFPIRTSNSGTPLLLGNIAQIRIGHALRFGAITQNGSEVVGMTVIMLKGQNSRDVVQAVKVKIDELQKKLPAGMSIRATYDRSEFIGRTLSTVFINLFEGALLVVLLLYGVLGTWQGALLVGSAIPISMLAAVIFMKPLDLVGNLMSLGAIDFGLLVDGSIVVLESVLAIIALDPKRSAVEVVTEGSVKVGRAAAFSILIILLVYLPLMTLEGVEGKMFRPMALTIALALAAALIFSLTTFPAALAWVFSRMPMPHASPAYWDLALKHYGSILKKVQANPRPLLVFAGGLLFLSLVLGWNLGSEFIPRIDEGEILIDIRRLPSTAIDYSKNLNIEMEKVLTTFPEVVSIVSRTGRGESAAEPVGTDEAELMIKLKPKSEWVTAKSLDALMNIMKDRLLAKVPATYMSMSQPIEDRVNELLAGSKADVVIKIYGNDLEKLRDLSERFAQKIRDIPGTGDLRVQRILGLPLLEVRVNQKKLARYGVQAREVLRSVEALRVGIPAGKVFEGLRRFDITLILDTDATSIESIENVPVLTHFGTTVPLGLVADIARQEGPAAIYRESLKRRVFVEVNIRDRDLGSYVQAAQAATRSLVETLPEGYQIKWGGQFENFVSARNRLMVVVPVIIFIIYGMLALAFNNFKLALGIFSIVPLSLTGGVIALFLRGLPFSIPAAVGMIALSGITVLGGVIYATHLIHLCQEGVPLEEATIRAAVESGRAVFITELIAAIGFLPLALSSGVGAEVQRPLATVVIGGIVAGTALAQLLLPTLMGWIRPEFFLNRKPTAKLTEKMGK